ncbi:DUF805 domain-containing protein [Rosenbergiella epipactidis]|uniref:DUF805 domain-containing protein n=1 Tax=Rosenbergiella epipactidis TaxID=1544694 RepID=UPI003BAAB060
MNHSLCERGARTLGGKAYTQISTASRRINDAGYSHWIILLVFFIPYLFFIFLCFPKTVDK